MADITHVNGKVETINLSSFDKGAQSCSMCGAVDDFEQLLVLEPVDDAKQSLACPRRRQGVRTILCSQARGERLPLGDARLAVPTKNSADEQTYLQKCAPGRR